MAEDVARAVGASSPNTVMIVGKECQPRPLTIKELTELERDCLKQYKREYLATFTDNSDLMPEELRTVLLREKFDEAGRWDLTDLPNRWAYDAASIVLNEKVVGWMVDEYGETVKEFPEKTKELTQRRIITSALDEGRLSVEEYEALAGTKPKRGKVGYVEWWITGTFEGMISTIWKCFQGQGVTKDDVARDLGRNKAMMASLSREIESLSAPNPGN